MAQHDATIHIRPIQAKGLMTPSFTRRQTPVVVVTLMGSKPLERSESFPAYNSSNPEWGHEEYNTMELYYKHSEHHKTQTLRVEVFSDSYKDTLLGIGDADVSKALQHTTKEPVTFSVALMDKLGEKQGERQGEKRGVITLSVWCGPPPRKLVRMAMRCHRLMEARDHLMAAMGALMCGFSRVMNRFLHLDTMRNFAVRNRKLSIFAAGVMGLMAAGMFGVFLFFAVPAAAVALFTFPLWIVPVLATSFFTAPIWIPLLVMLGFFVGTMAMIAFGVFITSHPVRRKCSMILQKMKHTSVAERLMYCREC